MKNTNVELVWFSHGMENKEVEASSGVGKASIQGRTESSGRVAGPGITLATARVLIQLASYYYVTTSLATDNCPVQNRTKKYQRIQKEYITIQTGL